MISYLVILTSPADSTECLWGKFAAAAIGVELLTEEETREIQKLGSFDAKTSSWVKTPPDFGDQGSALFCDHRYGHVITRDVGTSIVVGSGDGNVYSINGQTDIKLWNFQTGGRILSSPAYSDALSIAGVRTVAYTPSTTQLDSCDGASIVNRSKRYATQVILQLTVNNLIRVTFIFLDNYLLKSTEPQKHVD